MAPALRGWRPTSCHKTLCGLRVYLAIGAAELRFVVIVYALTCVAVYSDNVDVESSVLFDTVAVYLAYANSLCTLEALPIEVTDDGVTRIDSGGKANKVACAVQWKDLDGFHSHLVERLCRNQNKTRL